MLQLEGRYCKDCKIMNDEVEESALSTIYSILDNKAFQDKKIRIMPDVHDGKGIVIGFTSQLGEMINPSHVGVDIGCMISLYITNSKINKEDFEIINHRIIKEIPFGKEIYDSKQFETKEFIRFIRDFYNSQLALAPEYLNNVTINESYISNMLRRIRMDEGVFYKSIGTVGGGNHFIEINDFDGNYAFSIHSGSRNFGAKIGKYWITLAENKTVNKKLINKKIHEEVLKLEDKTKAKELIDSIYREEESKIVKDYLDGDKMRDYLTDMVIAMAYSRFNHEIIARKMLSIFKHLDTSCKIMDEIHSMHNYIDFSDKIIRKGAIRAHKDECILIPLNMKDGICIALGLGNEEWNNSCSHGSGRRMSRMKAKENISLEDFKKSMEDVYSTSVCQNTIDESPMAYKDSKQILSLISDTCKIVKTLKPIINIKCTNNE